MVIITIDGPTASGKSSLARALAQRLEFQLLATGLLYRAIAREYLQRCVPGLGDGENATLVPALILEIARDLSYWYDAQTGALVGIGGSWYSAADLKSAEIDGAASRISALPELREQLRLFQRAYATQHNVIVEGRDAGSVVFPQATCKLFLTASLPVRAERWYREQQLRGNSCSREEALRAVAQRDLRDETRACAPLCIPDGAQVLDASHLTLAQVVETALQHLQACLA